MVITILFIAPMLIIFISIPLDQRFNHKILICPDSALTVIYGNYREPEFPHCLQGNLVFVINLPSDMTTFLRLRELDYLFYKPADNIMICIRIVYIFNKGNIILLKWSVCHRTNIN